MVVPDGTPPTAVAAFDFFQFGPGSRHNPNLDHSLGTVTLGVQSSPEYRHAQATDDDVAELAAVVGRGGASPEEIRAAAVPLVVDTLAEVIGAQTDPKRNGLVFLE